MATLGTTQDPTQVLKNRLDTAFSKYQDPSGYSPEAQQSIEFGLKKGNVNFEPSATGGEYIGYPPPQLAGRTMTSTAATTPTSITPAQNPLQLPTQKFHLSAKQLLGLPQEAHAQGVPPSISQFQDTKNNWLQYYLLFNSLYGQLPSTPAQWATLNMVDALAKGMPPPRKSGGQLFQPFLQQPPLPPPQQSPPPAQSSNYKGGMIPDYVTYEGLPRNEMWVIQEYQRKGIPFPPEFKDRWEALLNENVPANLSKDVISEMDQQNPGRVLKAYQQMQAEGTPIPAWLQSEVDSINAANSTPVQPQQQQPPPSQNVPTGLGSDVTSMLRQLVLEKLLIQKDALSKQGWPIPQWLQTEIDSYNTANPTPVQPTGLLQGVNTSNIFQQNPPITGMKLKDTKNVFGRKDPFAKVQPTADINSWDALEKQASGDSSFTDQGFLGRPKMTPEEAVGVMRKAFAGPFIGGKKDPQSEEWTKAAMLLPHMPGGGISSQQLASMVQADLQAHKASTGNKDYNAEQDAAKQILASDMQGKSARTRDLRIIKAVLESARASHDEVPQFLGKSKTPFDNASQRIYDLWSEYVNKRLQGMPEDSYRVPKFPNQDALYQWVVDNQGQNPTPLEKKISDIRQNRTPESWKVIRGDTSLKDTQNIYPQKKSPFAQAQPTADVTPIKKNPIIPERTHEELNRIKFGAYPGENVSLVEKMQQKYPQYMKAFPDISAPLKSTEDAIYKSYLSRIPVDLLAYDYIPEYQKNSLVSDKGFGLDKYMKTVNRIAEISRGDKTDSRELGQLVNFLNFGRQTHEKQLAKGGNVGKKVSPQWDYFGGGKYTEDDKQHDAYQVQVYDNLINLLKNKGADTKNELTFDPNTTTDSMNVKAQNFMEDIIYDAQQRAKEGKPLTKFEQLWMSSSPPISRIGKAWDKYQRAILPPRSNLSSLAN